MTREQIKTDLRKAHARQERLVDRIALAAQNLEIVRCQIIDLKRALKTARPAPKFW